MGLINKSHQSCNKTIPGRHKRTTPGTKAWAEKHPSWTSKRILY